MAHSDVQDSFAVLRRSVDFTPISAELEAAEECSERFPARDYLDVFPGKRLGRLFEHMKWYPCFCSWLVLNFFILFILYLEFLCLCYGHLELLLLDWVAI